MTTQPDPRSNCHQGIVNPRRCNVAGTCHGTRSAILCLHGLAGARRRGCHERRDPKRRGARVRRMAVLTNRESDVTTTRAGARTALPARLSDPSRGTRGSRSGDLAASVRGQGRSLGVGGSLSFATPGPTTSCAEGAKPKRPCRDCGRSWARALSHRAVFTCHYLPAINSMV